jgi:hypothetical protein
MSTSVAPFQPVATAPAPARESPTDNLDKSLRVAKVIVAGGMAPKSYFTNANVDPVAAVWTAMQLGHEIGLSPMASVQNIAVINGKPGLYGTGMLAVVESSRLLAAIAEGVEGEGDARRGWCEVQRIGRERRRYEFSMGDAKRARLTGKQGPWQDYPDRMLLSRARSFALRDNFADVLLGLAHSAEELMDIPPEAPALEHRPAPPPPAPPPSPPPAPARAPITVREGGTITEYPRTKAGIAQALDLIASGGAVLTMENADLLSKIGAMDDFRERVGLIRAAAARELNTFDSLPGEAVGAEAPEQPEPGAEGDQWSEAIAVLRGARPAGMTEAEAAGLPE